MTRRASLFARALRGLAAGAVILLAGCGGGGGDNDTALRGTRNTGVDSVASPAISGSNVLQIVVDRGTDGSSINTPFVTVRVCQPGTSTCVDIDHVVLDTGSSGLRVAASALPAGFSLNAVPAPNGEPVGQCAQFASGFSWGSVRRADVRMGAEVASNISIQVVNDTALPYAQIPASCAGVGPNIGSGRGAKGILGVGFFRQDCGLACDVTAPGAPNFYYACGAGGGGCTATRLALASQVSNPVMSFAANNNGVVLVMPAVPSGGAGLATGSLVLGVNTQSNNQLGNATVYAADELGYFTTTYKGERYENSFLDSGSNGLFFNDDAIRSCGDFYCPTTSPLELFATNTSATGAVSGRIDFFIDSVERIRADAAAAHIGGTTSIPDSFDWGMPFFFGRSVFVGFAPPVGPGPTPFWAY